MPYSFCIYIAVWQTEAEADFMAAYITFSLSYEYTYKFGQHQNFVGFLLYDLYLTI